MINAKIWIYQARSEGNGDYTLNIYFQDFSKTQFLNIGDVVQDTSGNQFTIMDATLPFVDGGTVLTHYKINDTLPIVDSDYNSTVTTLGVFDPEPEIRTTGVIYQISVYDPLKYEYQARFSGSNYAVSMEAVVGDSLVDLNGKEFVITYLPPNKFDDTEFFRVQEVEFQGIYPMEGDCTLYKSSTNYGFYQGTEITDYARTIIQDRDFKKLDLRLTEVNPRRMYVNGTPPMVRGRAVKKIGSNQVTFADSLTQANATVVGIALDAVNAGELVTVQKYGTITAGVITQDNFVEGVFPQDGAWVFLANTEGKLTVSPPEEGSGLWSVMLGSWDNGELNLSVNQWGQA